MQKFDVTHARARARDVSSVPGGSIFLTSPQSSVRKSLFAIVLAFPSARPVSRARTGARASAHEVVKYNGTAEKQLILMTFATSTAESNIPAGFVAAVELKNS